MAFREKNAWIATLTTLIVWGYYFFEVWRAWDTRTLDGQVLLIRFLICMGITVVVMLGLNLLVARNISTDFGRPPDEMERQIESRAYRIVHRLGSWMLLGIAAASPWASGFIAAAFPADPAGSTAILIANAIVFALVLSEVTGELVLIIRFRMIA